MSTAFSRGSRLPSAVGLGFWRKMEDSNPQETIADLHIGFLDRCATRYTNLPYCRIAVLRYFYRRHFPTGQPLPPRLSAIHRQPQCHAANCTDFGFGGKRRYRAILSGSSDRHTSVYVIFPYGGACRIRTYPLLSEANGFAVRPLVPFE